MKIQQQDSSDVDIKLDSPEENSIYILTTLRVLNYQPDVDPVTFRFYYDTINSLNNFYHHKSIFKSAVYLGK